MFLRVYIRTFLNTLFVDNFVAGMFIKFCNKKSRFSIKKLKKYNKNPIINRERCNMFFQRVSGDMIDYNI